MANHWIDPLLLLQDVDLRLVTLNKLLAAEAAEKTALQAPVAAAEAAAETAKLEYQACEKRIKSLETKAESLRGKVKDFLAKTTMVTKQDEYKAALSQIDQCKVEIAGIEEEEMVLMESEDRLKSAVDAARKKVVEVAAEVKTKLNEYIAKNQDLRTEAETLKAHRPDLAKVIPPPVISIYDRLLKRRQQQDHGSRPLVAALIDDKKCGGCGSTMVSQTVINVMKGQPIACEYCNTILYLRH